MMVPKAFTFRLVTLFTELPIRLLYRFRRDDGTQLVELSLVIPMLMLIFVGSIDFGRAYFVRMEVDSAAEAAALYGIQNPADSSGIRAAALLDSPDLPNLTATSTYGYECPDGTFDTSHTAPPPTCSAGTVLYLEVDTTATYKPIIPYPGISSAFTMNGKSRMRSSF